MALRAGVREFVAKGALPAEPVATPDEVDERSRQLDAMQRPVTDEEAQELAALFGPDTCFGLAWTLLHLIETAPGAKTIPYAVNHDNEWVRLLEQRRA